MKNTLTSLAVGLLFAATALGALPTYVTLTSTNGYPFANVFFQNDPNSQIRVVYINYNTDTNNAVLSFYTGVTAYQVTSTNLATSSVTNQINSTNGLFAGARLFLHHGGVVFTNNVSSWSSTTNAGAAGGTNVVIQSGGWGTQVSPGDEIELMSSATTIPAPSASNGTTVTAAMSGDAIYVGNYGRDVWVTLTGVGVTNKLNSISAHYDSQSQ